MSLKAKLKQMSDKAKNRLIVDQLEADCRLAAMQGETELIINPLEERFTSLKISKAEIYDLFTYFLGFSPEDINYVGDNIVISWDKV